MLKALERLVRAALEEDVGQEDLTTNNTVHADARCEAKLIAKQDGVLSGIVPFRLAFDLMESDIHDWGACEDGTPFEKGALLASFTGNTRAVLTAERVALNFAQHLSGVATLTAKYVETVEGFQCRICCTRKTSPLLRRLEKEAVVDGGGFNHRHTLFNGILIKENHIAAVGSVKKAIQMAEEGTHHLMRMGVEVRNLEEFEEALEASAGVIMLDNMDLDTMRAAVKHAEGQRVVLEASGNASLDTVREMAETGVNVVSVGALTHSAPAVDLSLLIESVG